jgi:hypothetical protein
VITTLPDGTTRQALQRGPWHLPLAARDPPGTWRVRVTDVLSGVSAERVIEVK